MLRGSAIVLALGLLGLALGFAREWLLVRAWGAGVLSDGFIVGVFLPEAVRMTLSTGLLGSVALTLWAAHRDGPRAGPWSALLGAQLGALGLAAALLLALAPGVWVGLVGPGLAEAARGVGTQVLAVAAWALPFLLLAAWLTVFHHAEERFFWPAAGGVLFNGPPVAYLVLLGGRARPEVLALAQVAGAALACAVLVPRAWRAGWRPWGRDLPWRDSLVFYRRLLPLLASGAASQGGVWLERVLASFLDAGSVTVVHLARKLMGLPAMLITALSQVALARLVGSGERARVLAQALGLAALVASPAALATVALAPLLARWILPDAAGTATLAALVALFALALVPAGWNALLARWFYAHGETLQPTRVEVLGMGVQVAVTAGAFPLLGVYAFPAGTLAGVGWVWWRLLRRTPLRLHRFRLLGHLALLALVLLGLTYSPLPWAAPLTAGALLLALGLAGLAWGALLARTRARAKGHGEAGP